MKYNKAIWSGALSVASGLVFILTVAQPYLPTKVGVPIGIILLIAIPVVTYLVPNFDRIRADAEKVLKDAKTGNVTAVVHDGALFVREDLEPALTAGQAYRQKVDSEGATAILSGADGLIGDVERYAPALGKTVPAVTEVTAEIPKVEQAVHAARAGLAGIAKFTDTPIANEALAAASEASAVATKVTPIANVAVADAEKVMSALPVADLRKALGL
ncbi:hypothetical protein EF294_03545 [Gordonia oryzae]|uniref:Uncharacterized protein n=1 Tax=Gordonia oryzae TaxID=2487349 RepID=A0A3N4GS79_9ACTN|nr:hypothetical protein [Gordonia oryzae]RPA65823.1 hypothetical protein EF294_03545 [Gordonia oryzae]